MRGDRSSITHWIDWTTFEERDIDHTEEPDPANAVDLEHARRIAKLEVDIPHGEKLSKDDAKYREGASARARACKVGRFPDVMQRRLTIARLLAERGPLRTAEIVQATGIPDDQVYAAHQHPWFRREGRARATRIALTEEGMRAACSERAAS